MTIETKLLRVYYKFYKDLDKEVNQYNDLVVDFILHVATHLKWVDSTAQTTLRMHNISAQYFAVKGTIVHRSRAMATRTETISSEQF